jgi:hypothetical protein
MESKKITPQNQCSNSEPNDYLKKGDITTIHVLANTNQDFDFKVVGGRVVYEGTGYGNGASGVWVTISRWDLEKRRIFSRKIKHNTKVEILEVR